MRVLHLALRFVGRASLTTHPNSMSFFRHDARHVLGGRGTRQGSGTVGGKDDGVLTTSMIGCGKPSESAGVDLRIVDPEVSDSVSE